MGAQFDIAGSGGGGVGHRSLSETIARIYTETQGVMIFVMSLRPGLGSAASRGSVEPAHSTAASRGRAAALFARRAV